MFISSIQPTSVDACTANSEARPLYSVADKQKYEGTPRFPLKGSFKGDIGPYQGYIGFF